MIYAKTAALAAIGVAAVSFSSGAYLRGLVADTQLARLREAHAIEAAEQAQRNQKIQSEYDRRLTDAIDARDRAQADADDYQRELRSAIERMRVESETLSVVSVPGTATSARGAAKDRGGRLEKIQERGAALRAESAELLKRAEAIASRSESRAAALSALVTGAAAGAGRSDNAAGKNP